METNRSKWFLTGMAALLLSFGLVLSGCPTPVDNNEDGNQRVKDLAIIIEGEAQVGQKLTATVTGGSGAPDIRWQWTNDANEEEGWTIRDAKGEEYTLTSAEEGRYVRAYIFIANGNTVEYVYGDFVGPVEAAPVENDDDQGLNDLSVIIEGEARVGRTLTATVIGGSGAPDIRWQWTDDVNEEGWSINGARGNEYTLTSAEEGRYVRAYILIENGTSAKSVLYSDFVGPVEAAPVENDLSVIIEGEAQVGQKLTATLIGGSGAPDIRWQWTDDVNEEGSPIRGAKGDEYTLTPAEEGGYVRAYIFIASGDTAEYVYSDFVGPVEAAPDNDDDNPGDGDNNPGGGDNPGNDGDPEENPP